MQIVIFLRIYQNYSVYHQLLQVLSTSNLVVSWINWNRPLVWPAETRSPTTPPTGFPDIKVSGNRHFLQGTVYPSFSIFSDLFLDIKKRHALSVTGDHFDLGEFDIQKRESVKILGITYSNVISAHNNEINKPYKCECMFTQCDKLSTLTIFLWYGSCGNVSVK